MGRLLVRNGLLVGLLIFFMSGMALADLPPNLVREPAVNQLSGSQVTTPGVAGPFHFNSSLDEQLGDTINVVLNWRDQQHNAGYTRLIAIDDSDPENAVIHLTWTQHNTAAASPRYVAYSKLFVDGDGTITRHPEIHQVGSSGAGYPVISLDMESGTPYIMMHQPRTGGGYWSSLMTETIFIPGLFDSYNLTPPANGDFIWPQLAITNYQGTLYAHMISNGYEEAISNNVYYVRASFDPVDMGWVNATPGGVDSRVVTPYSMTLSSVPAANADGSLVTIAGSVSRWLQGEGPGDWDGTRMSQSNNDIYLWTSTDGGDTWDFESPFNLTQFIEPDESYLPGDTAAANGDTARAYCEVDILYDLENRLHVAFNTLEVDYWRTTGYSSYTGRMWYWNDDHQMFTMIADGTFYNGTTTLNAAPVAWELMVSHANLYKDEETGILWVSWVQYGEPDEIQEGDIPMDGSLAGYANSDIYVAASPDNGLRWTKAVNVTNTRNLAGQLGVGESRSERDPSLAYNSDGPYLHLFYTLDFDAGISEIPGQAEGAPTENQMVYHRVPKADLLEIFEENAEWVRNYPMHVDSSGMYVDPEDWEWTGFMPDYVPEGNTLQPGEFELSQNYPNPFNPSTQISFRLNNAGVVKLAVYDLLGREVATLVNRALNAGQHQINFLANDLSSGVYFYTLSSGDVSQTRKMILMK